MSLRYPLLLFLLLLIPAMLYFRFGRRRPAMRFSDGHALAHIPMTLAVLLQPILPALYAIGLALLVVALSRPQRGLSESRVKTEGVDIVLLVDVSTSMRAIDLSTPGREINRLDAAKQVIERFVEKRGSDRIGIVAFAALPYSVSPLTLDHGWLLQRMKQVETGMLEDGTAIGTAIASAVNRLRTSEAKSKLVILLTDGENNRGELSPEAAALAAKAIGIRIYTVGAGVDGIVSVPVQDQMGRTQYMRQLSKIDEATLTKISGITGARFFRATDLSSLKDVYDEIDKLEKTEIDVEQYTRFEEKFAPFLLAGLFCIVLERMGSLSRLGRLP